MNQLNSIVEKPRMYLDCLSEEYRGIHIDQKLLNTAIFLKEGGSLHRIVADYRNSNEPRITSTIYDTLLGYLVYLRTGEYVNEASCFLQERLTEAQLIEILSAELLNRLMSIPDKLGKDSYRLDMDSYYDFEGYARVRYEADKKMIYGEELFDKIVVTQDSRELLAMANPWLRIAKDIEDNNYENPHYAVHPEDRAIVEEYNDYAKAEHSLMLNLPPEPFQGNPLDAKVVILMLNPGFVLECNVLKYELLNDIEKVDFIKAKCRTMSLKDNLCVPDNDVINEIGENYWKRKLKSVLGIPDANRHIAIIQFLGYFSEKYNPIHERLFGNDIPLLYTQKYTMRLVRYLMQEERVIIIARAEKEWYKHIPELETYPKKVLLKSYLNPTISPANCADGGFELVKEALLK